MKETASLAVTFEESTNFKVDLTDNLLEVYYIASSRRINMLRLLHDRTGHGNENVLIAARKEKLITGMKDRDKVRTQEHTTVRYMCKRGWLPLGLDLLSSLPLPTLVILSLGALNTLVLDSIAISVSARW